MTVPCPFSLPRPRVLRGEGFFLYVYSVLLCLLPDLPCILRGCFLFLDNVPHVLVSSGPLLSHGMYEFFFLTNYKHIWLIQNLYLYIF
jgi:hypothetical protein